MIYFLLKSIHIISAIVALGANLTYGFLTFRAEKEPEHLLFTIKTIQWIDNKVANRGYIVVLITGLLLTWVAGYPLTQLWIWLSLTLFSSIALLGVIIYAPIIKRQVELIESEQTHTKSYQLIRMKSIGVGVLVTFLVIVILILMVFKPI